MAKPIRPMLPPLHQGHRVPPIPSPGVWHSLGSADPLRVIAKGLATTERIGDGADIVSVPDIWAQVTIFHNALTEETHPLHHRAVAEWRGLLACFGLAPYRVPGLTSEAFRLSDLAPSRWSTIVTRLLPHASLLGNDEIDEVAIVRVDGQSIAIAQPLTLLAPSRSLENLGGRPVVPWLSGGHFTDPLKTAGLGVEERWALTRFLDRVAASLEPHTQASDLSTLLGLVRAFAAEARPSGSAPSFEEVPSRTRLPSLRVFEPFSRWERAALAGAVVSDCLLRLRPGLDSHLKGVVLVDTELDRLLGRPASDLRVWGQISLRMLQDRPQMFGEIRSDAQAKGYLVLEVSDLFLPQLYRADGIGGERGFDQHPAGARERLLPLSPLVLAFLDGQALGAACRMASGGDGIAVHLGLPMASGGNVSLTRVYPKEEALEPPLSLSVWPDFQAPWWKLHLALTGASTGVQFSALGLISLEGIRQGLAANDGFSVVAAARAILSGKVSDLGKVTWLRDDRNVAQAVHRLPGAAEAALLEDRTADKGRLAGLLLLPPPRPSASGAAGTSAMIGIDFGTTNTAAYLRVGSGDPEPLRIPPRQITAYSVAEQGRDLLDREFLPATEVEIPFQTILRVRQRPNAGEDLHVFRDALIYFAQQRKSAIEQFQGTATDLHFNMKWADELDGRKRIELFLTEVAILALAEAGARGIAPEEVSFRFSFPEAFRPWQASGFKAAATNATRVAIETATGNRRGPPPRVEFQTESVASAQYFIHRLRAPATEGLVTFDIGGQTTDIAVAQSRTADVERLAWRGSFEIAGRHLLIDHLREHPGLLRALSKHRSDLKVLVDTLSEKKTLGEGRRTLATELVVNSQPFAEALDRDLGVLTQLPEAQRLRAVALTGLAGLLDFSGRVVRALAEEGRLEPRPNTAISLCIGGRASLLYRALLRSEEDRDAMLRFFTEATGDAMGRANLLFSEAPKEEVAYGLVRDDGSLMAGSYVSPPLGEGVEAGDERKAAGASVTELDLARSWRIEAAPEFQRFINRLPQIGIRPILPPAVFGALVGEANHEMQLARSRARADGTEEAVQNSSATEPPFIVLLRRLTHRLAVDPNPVRI
ncbi:acetate and sugar kinases/Hsc70/actin family protein [Belnapia rosea]|uniref:hypothetical protein n=1 Tax=Belnapia rosea TaxID=938405 RepID=UPI0008870511|nr:hypothetical protein [Belnapia rosea]SDB20562.1 hypothetical protein SAMN02927895_00810 [Belnapia rosea]